MVRLTVDEKEIKKVNNRYTGKRNKNLNNTRSMTVSRTNSAN